MHDSAETGRRHKDLHNCRYGGGGGGEKKGIVCNWGGGWVGGGVE